MQVFAFVITNKDLTSQTNTQPLSHCYYSNIAHVVRLQ